MRAFEVTDVHGQRYLVFADSMNLGGVTSEEEVSFTDKSGALVALFKNPTSFRQVALPTDGGVIRL